MVKDKIKAIPASARIMFQYFDRCNINRDGFSLLVEKKKGTARIPMSQNLCIMMGRGTSITHDAVSLCHEEEVPLIWCGDNMVKFYAAGYSSRPAKMILLQADHYQNHRIDVAIRMYKYMLDETMPSRRSINQMRGIEGGRVKKEYARLADKYGVQWSGRSYKPGAGASYSDNINFAISVANNILYALVESVVMVMGLSPAIGFIHDGKSRSFVFDIADTVKIELAVETAFRVVSESPSGDDIERLVRREMGCIFTNENIPARIVSVIEGVLDL